MLKPAENDFVNFLKETLPRFPKNKVAETAAPSFCHPNFLIRWVAWQRIRRALETIEKLSPKTILDFGSGSGVLLPFCAPKAKRVYALDINTCLLKETQKKYRLGNVKIIKYAGGKVPLKSETVDLVCALEVLEHLENLEQMLLQIYRLCKPGGYLLISLPTENIFYKGGRFLAGFKGDYHKNSYRRIIKKVEDKFEPIKYSTLSKFIPLYIFGLYKKED